MRLLKLHSALCFTLTSALFAGLWVMERKARENLEKALQQLEAEFDYRLTERTAMLMADNARLIELDQLKSKFLADAAHELRSPITNLNLRLYLLERATTPERRAQYLEDFKAQLTRLSKLTEDCLSISRLDSLDTSIDVSPVDLNRIAEEIVIAYRPLAEHSGLSLISEINRDLPPILGEENQLIRMGANLVANAIHYTHNGHILVSTLLDVERKLACLQVQDTGIGIEPRDIPHLFERFYRGHQNGAARPGTGLGLSIVKEIVDLHGGEIEVQSQVGKGTIFKVFFPLASALL